MTKISDIIIFEDWLSQQPVVTAEVMANRIALRMLPFWNEFRLSDTELSNEASLPFWRAVFLDWVFFNDDNDNTKLRLARDEARTDYVRHGDRAAYARFLSRKTQVEKSKALSQFLMALINRATEIVSSDAVSDRIWESISFDATQLDAGRSFSAISGNPLWVGPAPNWCLASWDTFKQFLLRPELIERHAHWTVWTDWYEQLLEGNKHDQGLEVKKALLPDVLWKQGAQKVNEAFARTIELHFERLEADKDQLSLLALLDSKEIRAAIADFEFNKLANLMRMVPFAEDHSDFDDKAQETKRRDMVSEVQEAFSDLLSDILEEKRNVSKAFLNALQRYADEASLKISDVRPGRLWDLGAIIHVASLDEDTEYSLGPIMVASLENAAEKHLDLMREYFADTIARQRVVDQLEFKPHVSQSEALQAMRDAANAMQTDDWGSLPAPEQEIPAIILQQVEELEALDLAATIASDERVRRKRAEALWRKVKIAGMTIVRYSVATLKAAFGVVATAATFNGAFPAAYAKAVGAIVELFKNIPWLS